MTQATLTILGCGNSTGIPAIGNYWGACDPNEPKNQRLRPSALIQGKNTTLVIDTGPDFREQFNRADISKIDAVLYSHAHGDHVNGMDELRILKFRNKMELMPIYANQETIEDLKRRFYYLFDGGAHEVYPPIVEPNALEPLYQEKKIGDLSFIPFEMDHGSCTAIGYRFGDCAYCVDMLTLDDSAVEILHGVETWIVDGASYKDKNNTVHAHLETIYALNERIQAKTVYITSLSLSMDYQILCDELPDGYFPAYDELEISINTCF